jgi:hypothetical protein
MPLRWPPTRPAVDWPALVVALAYRDQSHLALPRTATSGRPLTDDAAPAAFGGTSRRPAALQEGQRRSGVNLGCSAGIAVMWSTTSVWSSDMTIA